MIDSSLARIASLEGATVVASVDAGKVEDGGEDCFVDVLELIKEFSNARETGLLSRGNVGGLE